MYTVYDLQTLCNIIFNYIISTPTSLLDINCSSAQRNQIGIYVYVELPNTQNTFSRRIPDLIRIHLTQNLLPHGSCLW